MDSVAQRLDQSPMTWRQYAVVAITIALNALDGFDVLSISFASPGIAAEWGIDKAALGFVLSLELIGMAAGSVLIGRAGDRFGRRPTALLCLLLMAGGMFMASIASGIADLSLWRIVTGLGIGGMLAVTNAITPEVSNARQRSIAHSLMVIGYPIGAILGGIVTSFLLRENDWRIVFEFGALCTALMVPLVWYLVPETPAFLIAKRPPDALQRLNHSLHRLGHAPVDALPDAAAQPGNGTFMDLVAPGIARNTILITIAYFAQLTTFYFVLKWTPKIVVDMGYAASAAAGVLVWANVGGALGGLVFGLAARKFALKSVCITAFASSAVMVGLFGQSGDGLGQLSLLAALAGFSTNAGIVGLYSLAANGFPTHLRSSGTGFVIGFGRGGAILGPTLAGLLFQVGFGVPGVAVVMATGAILAVIAIINLRLSKTGQVVTL